MFTIRDEDSRVNFDARRVLASCKAVAKAMAASVLCVSLAQAASMNFVLDQSNKLPLVVEGLKQLTRELSETDRVAIVVYASAEGLALPSTRGSQRETILATLGQLRAGGRRDGAPSLRP